MPNGLQLHVTDFRDETRWRWELRDEKGAFLGDHEVRLDRAAAEQNLARSSLPSSPPPFEEVARRVEEIDGVHFRKLFERLPKRAPDGDAAIAEVWRMVHEERTRSTEKMAEAARVFAPLQRDIARVARGDERPRAAIEAELPQLEKNGWRLSGAVQRIWAGERGAEALTADVDPNSAQLIRRILELIEQPSPEEVLSTAPEGVRRAIETKDVEALKAAIGEMPEEGMALLERMRQARILGFEG